ncbi:hypothetical protein BDW02DRAFT_568837 [Decorospora gaudefroyi]|uniref:Uncharacterized protein n=1 Tax=Decorospora gaudefroyi TaxID=184978 RepID=A0A6A5KE73_9PLEO|nr:hypothetical protein BDW02DRAFT_568837 [Decorospora gaudefroyi]
MYPTFTAVPISARVRTQSKRACAPSVRCSCMHKQFAPLLSSLRIINSPHYSSLRIINSIHNSSPKIINSLYNSSLRTINSTHNSSPQTNNSPHTSTTKPKNTFKQTFPNTPTNQTQPTTAMSQPQPPNRPHGPTHRQGQATSDPTPTPTSHPQSDDDESRRYSDPFYYDTQGIPSWNESGPIPRIPPRHPARVYAQIVGGGPYALGTKDSNQKLCREAIGAVKTSSSKVALSSLPDTPVVMEGMPPTKRHQQPPRTLETPSMPPPTKQHQQPSRTLESPGMPPPTKRHQQPSRTLESPGMSPTKRHQQPSRTLVSRAEHQARALAQLEGALPVRQFQRQSAVPEGLDLDKIKIAKEESGGKTPSEAMMDVWDAIRSTEQAAEKVCTLTELGTERNGTKRCWYKVFRKP